MADPYAEFGGSAVPQNSDPYAEFGGKTQAAADNTPPQVKAQRVRDLARQQAGGYLPGMPQAPNPIMSASPNTLGALYGAEAEGPLGRLAAKVPGLVNAVAPVAAYRSAKSLYTAAKTGQMPPEVPRSLGDVGAALTGTDKQYMEQKAAEGESMPIVSEAVASAVPWMVGAKLAGGERPPTPLPKEAAVTQIVRAVNPEPRSVPSIQQNLAANMDRIAAHANEIKQPINGVADLAKVVKSAAESDPYRKLFIDPLKDERLPAPQGFRGGVSQSEPGGAATTTIGQLDKRLSTINDTLFPKYQRGGAESVSAHAAIGAEDAVALTAEAAKIRATIAQYVGNKLGVDPQVVYQMRGRYGQLEQLAGQLELESNKSSRGVNRAANEPIRVSDVKALGNIPINPKNWRGNIPDRLVRDAFKRYQTQPIAPVTSNPPAQSSRQRVPAWQRSSF